MMSKKEREARKMKYNAAHTDPIERETGEERRRKLALEETAGRKDDTGKPRWDLLPLDVVEHIVRVLTFGAKKYAPGNWKSVPDARDRYFAAAIRHLTKWQAGEVMDPESGLSHLAHAACCLVFLIWGEKNGAEPHMDRLAREYYGRHNSDA